MSATWRRCSRSIWAATRDQASSSLKPAMLDQASHGHVLGRVHHHDGVQLEPLGRDDAEERHIEHHDRVGGAQRLGPLGHDLADHGVGELIELAELIGIAEHDAGQSGPVDRPSGRTTPGPKWSTTVW